MPPLFPVIIHLIPAVNQKGGVGKTIKAVLLALLSIALPFASRADDLDDEDIFFATIGPDRYADGSLVLGGFVRVQGGATLDSIGETIAPAIENSGDEGDIALLAPATGPDSGFFRVVRN